MTTPQTTKYFAIEQITVGDRVRGIDEAAVASLMQSIGEVGLLQPITVRPRDGSSDYELVAGLHRLEACKRLGWKQIEVKFMYGLSDEQAKLAECDENLVTATLTPADRARFTAERKRAYEALHPESKHGGDRRSDQVDNLATRSFAEDQAAVTGVDERTVRRDAERGSKIAYEVLDLMRGTALDTGTYLDMLKTLPPDEHMARVKADLSAAKKPKPKPQPKRLTRPEREVEAEVTRRVEVEVGRLLDRLLGPYVERIKEAERVITARKGAMDLATFEQIRNALHPDFNDGPKRGHAFAAFNRLKDVLVAEAEHPLASDLPRTLADLLALKEQVRAERAAARKQAKGYPMPGADTYTSKR